jgi:Spy/CpxP family protein refolding chaperone
MVKLSTVLVVSLLSLGIIVSCARSPYKGQELREIKALPPEDIQGYLEGQGMGMAKAAELNSYPGPLHAMELSRKLQLTEHQRVKTEEIFDQMRVEAVRLGTLIVEREALLDRLFAEGTIDEMQLSELLDEIADLRGRLRYVHLRAHLQLKEVLSADQVEKYNMLRGYTDGRAGKRNGHSTHEHS